MAAIFNNQESFITAINNVRKILLEKKPYIKKYYKIRKMHSEIVTTMAQYYHDGKFKRQIDAGSSFEHEEIFQLLECDFNLGTDAGNQGFYDTLIYKAAPNVSCITDDFLRDHRYKKPEKIELLQSMLNSKLVLLEIIKTKMEEGCVYIKDVFTGDEYRMVDIGLSGNTHNDDIYFYLRIITYQDITFGTGLSFLFNKTDDFIRSFIERQKKDFNPNGEFLRFMQLYKRYSNDPGNVKIFINEIK